MKTLNNILFNFTHYKAAHKNLRSLKFLLVIAISVGAMATVSAQVTWDSQPSDCDNNRKRSIGVTVKNNTNAPGNYYMEVYSSSGNAGTFIHGSHKVYININETKPIVLNGIPMGNFIVIIKNNGSFVALERFDFKFCPKVEDIIIWADEASECDENERRLVAVDVINKSNEAHQYKITVYDGEQFKHGGGQKTIQPNGSKTIELGGMPKLGYYQVRLEKDGIVSSTKNYRFRACGTEQPAEVEWAMYPGNCDQNNKRDIDVEVHNNSTQQKSFKIKIFKQDNTIVHGGLDIAITARSKKTLNLGGIPPGYFRVQVISNDRVVGSNNYIFENCDVSTSNIGNLKQVKNFEPFFTKMENTFTINIAEYFKSTQCSNIAYAFKKLSPGINYQLSGSILSVVSTPSFLGKSLLEITAQCGNKQIVETITIHTQAPNSLLENCNTQIVNVGVLNFSPVMTQPEYGNKFIHEVYEPWNDPVTLSEAYIDAITKASGNYIYFNLTDWSYFNEFPIQNDGSQFNPYTYDAHLKKEGDRNVTTRIDYPKILQEYGMVEKINEKQVDEVWFWGGAFFGEWEASMAGPRAYFVNGGVYPEVESERPFVFLGFNYQREVTQMMHSNGHRAENHIKRAYNNTWNLYNPVTNWDKFTANISESDVEVYGVGSVHFPANGAPGDNGWGYDYNNDRKVKSNALDFANYPNLTGATTEINKDTWGGNHEGYMKWWFNLLPKADGINADGRMNNWWKYIYDYSSYNKSGSSINTKFQTQFYPDWQQFTEGTGRVLLFDLDDYYIDTDVALPQIRLTVHREGINVYKVGTKVYAYIPPKSAGFYNCLIKLCDGDHTYRKYVNIYVNKAGYKIKNPATIMESNNYPNPFNTQTTITYTLPQSSKVSIKIYNSAGEQIEVLTNSVMQQAGLHQVNFDGTNYPSGIYYYGIQSDQHFDMQKMVLIND